MTNRYTRALKQLKNKSIDEKLELLSEIPTNNSGGFYVDVPGVYTTLPITNPVGQAGDPVDLDQDGDGAEGYAGADTTGLFKEDGTVLTVIPPGDNSYILGPMISMWYAWANYTQIGYVRQSDRKMVNLGRIVGEMSDWDGSTGFTGYGQMSVEQAAWYQSQSRQDYRAFYPGPPSNPADSHGRYLGSIVNESRFPNTTRQPSVAHTPGTQRGFDPSDDFASLLKKKELEDKNRSDEILRTVLNAAMLGLDIVAVLAVLFPDPISSAAGAAILGSKLRYVARLGRALSRLNPFKSSPKPRITYRNRPTKARYKSDPMDKVLRDIDKASDSLGNKPRIDPTGPVKKRFPIGDSFKYNTNKINYLLETATAVPSLAGGGTDVVDGYVDKVSETSSPEELEQASNDANSIAKEGGKGLSDSDLAKIDKDAEAEAKRLTNFDVSNPESMNADQLNASTEMMYEIDPDWLTESFDRNESLIDTVKFDKLYNEYTERRSYIGSLEHGFSISPEFKGYYKRAEYLRDTYVSQITFVDGYYNLDGRQVPYVYTVNKNTGERIVGSDFLYKKLMEWSDLFGKTWDTFNSKTVRDRVNKDREENENNYRKQSDILFRPFYIQIIREWSQRGADVNDDPFSIKDYINQQFGNSMSEAEKKKLKNLMQKLGIVKVETASYKDNEKLRPQGPSTPVYYDKHMKQIVPTGNEGQILNDMLKKAKNNNNQSLVAHFEPKFLKNRERKNLTEIVTPKQKKILREIRKPFEIKEAPTKFKVKPTGRKNKSVGVDMMKIPEIPNQFKPPAPSIWSAKDREKNIRASQEKKNEVLELVGAAEHHWTYLTEKKRKEDQEKVNEMMSIEFDKHLELMYENHKIKEERINKAIKAVKKSSDLAPEYPENPPPQPDPETGMHPKYGKHYKHDKLDPHSAEAMPPTGNPEIDANVKKAMNAKEKARKIKNLMGKTKRG